LTRRWGDGELELLERRQGDGGLELLRLRQGDGGVGGEKTWWWFEEGGVKVRRYGRNDGGINMMVCTYFAMNFY